MTRESTPGTTSQTQILRVAEITFPRPVPDGTCNWIQALGIDKDKESENKVRLSPTKRGFGASPTRSNQPVSRRQNNKSNRTVRKELPPLFAEHFMDFQSTSFKLQKRDLVDNEIALRTCSERGRWVITST